jgi:protein-L-isoaspartate(D-aspartate) O-methyltransferase
MTVEDQYRDERLRMVERQIAARGIQDPRVLDAMRAIPRHIFVPPTYRSVAYGDHPLPIGEGQTISQPYIVAMMTELLEPHAEDRILEIGAGSGYQAAILGKLVRRVVTIERIPEVAEGARRHLEELGIHNVVLIVGDGTLGHPAEAPYDAVIITASTPEVPQPLIEQLAEGGRLVAPVGGREYQELIRIVKRKGRLETESYGGVVFVPLIGEHGWRPETRGEGYS